MSITRENFFWHKLHSLTGVIPIGFYMLQHITLNSFSLAGADKFNAVIAFFQGVPRHILTALEILLLGLPILFHGVYGLFITSRAEPNVDNPHYQWAENRMYTLQRWTGVALFLLLIAHVATTTINAKINGEQVIQFQAWHEKLTSYYYLPLFLYLVGVIAASYHLCYGLWNFCIRWGITISERSQLAMRRFAFGAFIVVTLIGWGALFGFLREPGASGGPAGETQVRAPASGQPNAPYVPL